jgi:hypothetical protein
MGMNLKLDSPEELLENTNEYEVSFHFLFSFPPPKSLQGEPLFPVGRLTYGRTTNPDNLYRIACLMLLKDLKHLVVSTARSCRSQLFLTL